MQVFAVFILIIGIVFGQTSTPAPTTNTLNTRCEVPSTVPLSQFSNSSAWHARKTIKNTNCATITFYRLNNGKNYIEISEPVGEQSKLIEEIETENGTFNYNTQGTVGNLYIVDTDYSTYILSYACGTRKGAPVEKFWLLQPTGTKEFTNLDDKLKLLNLTHLQPDISDCPTNEKDVYLTVSTTEDTKQLLTNRTTIKPTATLTNETKPLINVTNDSKSIKASDSKSVNASDKKSGAATLGINLFIISGLLVTSTLLFKMH